MSRPRAYSIAGFTVLLFLGVAGTLAAGFAVGVFIYLVSIVPGGPGLMDISMPGLYVSLGAPPGDLPLPAVRPGPAAVRPAAEGGNVAALGRPGAGCGRVTGLPGSLIGRCSCGSMPRPERARLVVIERTQWPG